MPVNWRLAPRRRSPRSSTTRPPSVLVVGAEHVAAIASVADALAVGSACSSRSARSGAFEGAVRIETLGRCARTGRSGAPTGADDVALQLYTSGTTGRPKGAMLTNRNVWSMLPATARDWGFDADSVNLVALPNFHVGGVGWALVGLFAGASSVVLPEFAVGAVLEAITTHRVTHVVLVPAVLPALLDAASAAGSDVSSLRDDRLRRLADLRERPRPGGAAALVRLHPGLRTDRDGRRRDPPARGRPRPRGEHRHRLRSAGRPMEGVEVRIVEPASGCDVATGAVGEIWMRTPRVMLGYWNQPEADAQGDHAGRMAAHRRRRLRRRRRVRVPQRSRQGHDHLRWREHLSGRGRERPDGASRASRTWR